MTTTPTHPTPTQQDDKPDRIDLSQGITPEVIEQVWKVVNIPALARALDDTRALIEVKEREAAQS